MSVAYQQCAIDIGPGNARWQCDNYNLKYHKDVCA